MDADIDADAYKKDVAVLVEEIRTMLSLDDVIVMNNKTTHNYNKGGDTTATTDTDTDADANKNDTTDITTVTSTSTSQSNAPIALFVQSQRLAEKKAKEYHNDAQSAVRRNAEIVQKRFVSEKNLDQ